MGAAYGTLAIDTTEAHTGSASLRFTAASDSDFTFLWKNFSDAARIAFTEETSFTFSSWARVEPSGAPVGMSIACLDSNYDQTDYLIIQNFKPTSDWGFFSVDYTCPASTQFASVRLFVFQDGAISWWDDMRFDRVDSPGSNLLGNGGFETGQLMGPFQNGIGGNLSLDQSTVFTGQYSLRMDATSSDHYTGPYHSTSEAAVVALPPSGTQLQLSAWAKAEDTNDDNVQVQLRIFCLNNDYSVGTSTFETFTASTNWQKFNLSQHCPAGMPFASVRLDADETGATVWWDELWLESDPQFTNRLLDPDFEGNQLPLPFQQAAGGSVSFDSSTALTGSTSLRLTATTNSAYTIPNGGSSIGTVFPLEDPNEYLNFTAWAKADANNVPILLYIFCLNETYQWSSAGSNYSVGYADTSWTRFSAGHKCGTDTKFVSVRLDVHGAGRTVWWDALELSSSRGTFSEPPAPFTHTARFNSNWHIASNWDTGEVPGDDAIVHIPAGRSINFKQQENARYRFIQVDGTLNIANALDTRLFVDTLYIGPTGSLILGDPSNRLDDTKTAEILFINTGSFDLSWDPGQASRGLISNGTVKLYGAEKTPYVTMTRDALAGDSTLTLDVDLEATGANWKVDDEIVLTGTYFRRYEESRDERRVITAISGDQITLDQPLTFDHMRADNAFALHVANLTRNIVLRSETLGGQSRGHVMLTNRDVDIRHAAFVELGRTNKGFPLDDTIVELQSGKTVDQCIAGTFTPEETYTGRVQVPNPSQVANPRGRYSVHFHLNGIQPSASTPPSLVHDSVVDGTPGWGYVNHTSHVDFQRNIAYDFVGAAFVTEAGDELGNFVDNLAIRGTGTVGSPATVDYRKTRLVFQNCERPQPLSDFAFSGDGFWFQGPAIRVRGNIANGCNGAGMIWFTTGAPDITDIDPHDDRNNYVGFPASAVEEVYGDFPDFPSFGGRRWNHAPDQVVISDLPILECDGFESYGNFIGFRIRFNNQDNTSWYDDLPSDYDSDLLPVPDTGNPFGSPWMREQISNLTLWNNEQGFRARYTSRVDLENVTIVNRLAYQTGEVRNRSGIEIRHFVGDMRFDPLGHATLTNITVDGFPIANWLRPGRESNVQYLDTPIHRNYAMVEDNYAPGSDECLAVDSNMISVDAMGSTSVTLSWPVTMATIGIRKHERYLISYWVSGQDDHVQFADSPASGPTQTMTLTGLDPNTTYNYQVAAGCDQLPSASWSSVRAVNTLP